MSEQRVDRRYLENYLALFKRWYEEDCEKVEKLLGEKGDPYRAGYRSGCRDTEKLVVKMLESALED